MLDMKRGPGAPARMRGALWGLTCALALIGSAAPLRAEDSVAPVSQKAADLKTMTIPVEGMVCISCAATVKRTVKAFDGVSAVEVMLTKNSVEVTYDPGRLSPDRVVAAINALGYKASPPIVAAQ